MGPGAVVEVDPLADDPPGDKAVAQFVQIDRLVFKRAPQPFYEDVVQEAAATVHGDRHTRIHERAGKVEAGKLAPLIRIENFAPRMFQKLGERFNTKICL